MERGSDAFIGNMEELQCKSGLNVIQVSILLQRYDSDAGPDKINKTNGKIRVGRGGGIYERGVLVG